MSATFSLHQLGWQAFQELCRTILCEILGQTVESFLDTHDAGQDGGFAGVWKKADGEDLRGRFVLQCKHTSKPAVNLQPSDLSDELAKTKELVAQGRCDSYLLMTNAGLTGSNQLKIKTSLEKAGVEHTRFFGSTWINRQIRESKRLRMLVPRVYGLGDLTQILDDRPYRQAKTILASMRDDLSKVVLTGTYRRAARALEEHRFVLLTGAAAAGKTTIASLLSLAAIDRWDASPLKLDNPGNLVDHWNPDEPTQLFWLDDAFGVTQYEHQRVLDWNHVLPRLRPMLRSGATIIMTSRDYIYNRARQTLKVGAFPLLNESQVVVDVRDLTLDEKRQILYNHIRLGDQPRTFRARIKPQLEHVARHDRFIPETARRLADPFFTKHLRPSKYDVMAFVQKQESFLEEVVKGLDSDSQAALALIYLRGGRLESQIVLYPEEREVLDRLGSQLGACIRALQAMRGSLVVHTDEEHSTYWQFKHPTIGDAYASGLADNPEHLAILVRGGNPGQLVNQVTCGDVGIENAIVLTSELFPLMLARLDDLLKLPLDDPSDRWWKTRRRDSLMAFLARRCSASFLSLYLSHRPTLLEDVAEPGLFLDAVSEVDVARRLHEAGLLPEEHRSRFVQTVSHYAVTGEDLYALADDDIRTLFTDAEFRNMETQIRCGLLPRLRDVRFDWELECESNNEPELIHKRLEDLDSLRQHFSNDAAVVDLVEEQEAAVNSWVWENMPEEDETEVSQQRFRTSDVPSLPGGERSIFDDIDT